MRSEARLRIEQIPSLETELVACAQSETLACRGLGGITGIAELTGSHEDAPFCLQKMPIQGLVQYTT